MLRCLPQVALFFTSLLPAGETAKPNVILIISGDQGLPGCGSMGSKSVATPNLDRMASESLLCTRGHVMPVRSPSRASLQARKMPHGHGITGNDDLSGGRSKADHRALPVEQLPGISPMLAKAVTGAGGGRVGTLVKGCFSCGRFLTLFERH